MIRCRRCGLRLPEAQPQCPTHGAQLDAKAGPVEARAPDAVEESAAAQFALLGYRVTGVLGRGGFGSVYAAERSSDGSAVAIKVARNDPPESSEILTREAAALRAIGPPYVPSVYESGQLAGDSYVVLERIVAPTLAERLIAQAGPLPPTLLHALAQAILNALEAIHARGFVHRDLKPENIFICGEGLALQARIIDFGLATAQGKSGESLETTSHADVGTAEYMSPEQCEGLTDADRRSDIYSMGVLLYELASGAPPFWGQAAEVREAHRSRRPLPLARKVACTLELDAAVRRCLAKDRKQRFDDVAALRGALDAALLAHVPVRSGPPAPLRSQRPAPAAAPVREKRVMGLVFFESRVGLGQVQATVKAAGGQIVQTDGARYVAAFGHDVGDNPARLALVAAHRLFAAHVAERLLVDVAQVSVQTRPDGSRRAFSAVFTKQDRFPIAAEPAGVMLTRAATEVIPGVQATALDLGDKVQRDRFVIQVKTSASEATTFGIQLTPLVGRDEIVDSLLVSARRAIATALPTLVTVLGDNGYGRTHLASFIADRLEHELEGIDVIRLTAQEGVVQADSPVLPELLRKLLDLPVTAPEGHGKALLLERLGDLGEGVWVAAAHALGWIEAEHPELRRLAAAPGALRLLAARAAGEALRKYASHKKPVALLLDDAQLADEPALDALEYATLKGGSAGVWVCVLARSSFETSRSAWGTRAAQAEKHVLGPLAANHAVELARRLLLPAEYIPEAALLRLAERTQGVPRLLVELVRGLKRDGYVRRSERGTGYYLATDELEKLPDLPIVQWNAMREIEALPAQLSGHARLASVLGANFSLQELEALLQVLERDASPEDTQLDGSVGIQRLIDAGILLRHRTGLYDFRHALLRDTVYQSIPEAQHKRLHRAAFEAYRSLAMPDEQRTPRLALHASRCGEREIAAAAYLELAQRLGHVQAYLDAEAAYGSALENLPESDARGIDALRGRGQMRSRLGRQEAALQDLRKARALAHTVGARASELELMLDEATVLDWTRDMTQSVTLVQSVASTGEALSPLLHARLTMSLARVHHRHNEPEQTVRVGNEAVRLAQALGDEGYETRIIALLMVATDYASTGQLEQAERGFEQVIELAESHGDLWHVAAALGNRAVLWHARKNVDRLFTDLARAAQLGREIGEALMEFVAVHNIAETEYTLGRLERALAPAWRALELARQLFGEQNAEVSLAELLLARIALYGEDREAARVYSRRIRARALRNDVTKPVDAELSGSDQLLLEMIELGSEDAPLAAWDALVERARSLELQPMETVELLERAALSAARANDVAAGKRFYEAALELSANKPTLMSTRIVHKLAPLLGAA